MPIKFLKKAYLYVNPLPFMVEIKNTLKLLRFHFSLFLLPVSLFSLYFIKPAADFPLLLVLMIWHCLVFPSSNGYNSYNDQDEGPIGGLAAPPKVTRLLLHFVNAMDLLAILLSFMVNAVFPVFVAIYILASRLYSARGIRLKKYPVTGFLIVFIFQGAWIFCGNVIALAGISLFKEPSVILAAIACSFLVGTIYPITQIYQHEADQKEGVKTLSMLLGLRSTFVFTIVMFAITNAIIFLTFSGAPGNFWLFNLVMLPSTCFFLAWAFRSFRDTVHVNFKNTMIMLVLSSMLNNLYFFLILFKN